MKTTVVDQARLCPLGNQQRRVGRTNTPGVDGFQYVSTWAGFVFLACVIDMCARLIVGWKSSRTASRSSKA